MRIFDFRFSICDWVGTCERRPRGRYKIANRKSQIANLLLLLFAGPAFAITPAVLVDPQLEAQAVNVTSLRDGMLSYFDAQRRLQHEPVERFVQLREIGGAPAPPALGVAGAVVELTDGQRLVGRWIGASADGRSLVWEHPVLGGVNVPLDRLARLVREPGGAGAVAAADPGAGADDVVVLSNGDELRGFIESVGDEGLSILPAGQAEAMVLPLDRVRALRLANPPEPPTPGLHTLTLADGSRVSLSELEITGDHLRGRVPLADAGSVELPLSQVARVDFTASGLRLIDLVDCAWRVTDGGEVFELRFAPRVVERAMLLHAPVTVTFSVPENARRFAGVAELAGGDDAPPDLARWADFEVVVHSGADAPQRHRLHAGAPAARLNVPITGGELSLELDPAINGPILDRLRLRDAVLLIAPDDDGLSDARR